MLDLSELYPIFQACNAAAAETVLPPPVVAWCTDAYLALKLSFVPGMTLEAYADLDAAGRAEVNREGYAGLRLWMASQENGAAL